MKGVLTPDNGSDADTDKGRDAANVALSSSYAKAHITSKLEQQLRMLTDEKEQALEMVAKANHQVDTLQRQFKVRSSPRIAFFTQTVPYTVLTVSMCSMCLPIGTLTPMSDFSELKSLF